MNRVILNLLSNSYKFTSEDGTIRVSVLEKNSEGDHSSFEIHVRDSGIGMSDEFVKKMFSPFERERSSTVSGTEGTELGLSIAKSIIDLMDGTIEVVTSPGNGTDIILNLKLKLAEEQDIIKEESDIAGPTKEVSFKGKKPTFL